MPRRQTQQTIAWFWDQYERDRLDLDPPYQRRSVWNQSYRDYFIDTILLEYPAPAIFLFDELSPDGVSIFHVVDGKQRLTTIFEFIQNRFPVADSAKLEALRGLYFKDLDDDRKRTFWAYEFSVEYLPSAEEGVINEIFDRINRNTARLTAQELRHARYDGVFITRCEELTDWMTTQLPQGFPNIASQSRKQMKDVELVAQILLRLEGEPRGYSTALLDEAFSNRDTEWEPAIEIENTFRSLIATTKEILETEPGTALQRSRIRNQTDFYSLMGALSRCDLASLDEVEAATRLLAFMEVVEDDEARMGDEQAKEYYEAARSASNDTAQRVLRENILAEVLNQ